MAYRLCGIAAALVLAASPTPVPGPGAAQPTAVETPAAVPCPVNPAAAKVRVPPNTLPPAPPADPAAPVIGGPAMGTTGLAVPSGAAPLPANLAAHAWLVADLDTGEVLGACAPHVRYPPASVQKLLLVATVMPRLDPNQAVQVTQADLDFEPGSSAVGLVVGGTYPVSTLWLGLLLQSGTDAAQVLARVGGGADGVPGTLRDMNDLAYRLGARDTHAVTPSGLDGPGQFTSAYDLALIFREDFGLTDFRRYTLTQSAAMPAQPAQKAKGFQFQNDNQLIFDYPGALGGKNGFTDAARHTYVGAAERNGHRLVVTIMDAEAVPQRTWLQGAGLLDWGFAVDGRGSVGHLVRPGELDPPSPSAARPVARRPPPAGSSLLTGSGGLPLGAAVTVPVAGLVAAALLVRRRARRRRGSSRHRYVSGGPTPP